MSYNMEIAILTILDLMFFYVPYANLATRTGVEDPQQGPANQ